MGIGPFRHHVTALGIAILGAVGVPATHAEVPPSAVPDAATVVRAGFLPAAHEDSLVTGATPLERVAVLGQLDALASTTGDSVRALPAACLSAYLLLGGEFAPVARAFDVPTAFTFGHVHRVQEALLRAADRDGEPGVTAAGEAMYDTADVLFDWSMRGNDESHRVFQRLDLGSERLYGRTRDTEWRRADRLVPLIAEDPGRVFLVGLWRDPGSGELLPLPEGASENHWVLVVWHADAFHVLDPWRATGESGLVRWSDETAATMLFETPNTVYWLRRGR
ncbi:MAG: hypothetical protein ACKO3S_09300 [bacterium]